MTYRGQKIIRILGKVIGGTKTIIIQYEDKTAMKITFKRKEGGRHDSEPIRKGNHQNYEILVNVNEKVSHVITKI